MIENNIRKVKKSDYSKLLLISDDEWKGIVITAIKDIMQRQSDIELCLVAEVDDCLIGFVYGYILPNNVLIPEFLYVQNKYRKNGIGKRLLEELEFQSGCVSSMIFYNKNLHNYYKKQGYMAGNNLEIAMKDLTGQGGD